MSRSDLTRYYAVPVIPSQCYGLAEVSMMTGYQNEICEIMGKVANDYRMPRKMKPVPWWRKWLLHTFGCAWWHLKTHGFKSWLIWELEGRPRRKGPCKGPWDLIDGHPHIGVLTHATCSKIFDDRTGGCPPYTPKGEPNE